MLNITRIHIINILFYNFMLKNKRCRYTLFFKLNTIEKSSVNEIQACNIFYTKCILLNMKAKKIIIIIHTNLEANVEFE